MRKIFSIIGLGFALLALIGCGKAEQKKDEPVPYSRGPSAEPHIGAPTLPPPN